VTEKVSHLGTLPNFKSLALPYFTFARHITG